VQKNIYKKTRIKQKTVQHGKKCIKEPATSVPLSMACEKMNPKKKKYGFFSLTEIDAAKLLIELSNSTAYLDENCHSNSSNSVTVQSKTQQSKGSDDISPSSPTDSVEDVLAEIEEDERLRRKNKRFRYVEEVYRGTDPIVILPPFNEN
jgi:hypothetical protein